MRRWRITFLVKGGVPFLVGKELQKYISDADRIISQKPTENCATHYISAATLAISEYKDVDFAKEQCRKAINNLNTIVRSKKNMNIYELDSYCFQNGIEPMTSMEMALYWRAVNVLAPYDVHSFFRYIELDTAPEKRFYHPRMKTLKKIIEAYQQIYDGELDFLSVSQPKRTGKTSAGLRLALMMGGRKPDGSIFATGMGQGLVKSFFGGLNEVFDGEKSYARYLEVFPDAVKVGQNAEELTIHLQEKRRFATFTCRPIDGSIVGNTEANVLLYLDDCVKNHEEARNRDRLEFLCEKVTDDVLGRRIEGTPIVIQGTKYSLHDPITHLQEKAELMGWRWREVAIPALDENDESNWEIEKEGKKIFTTEYYKRERTLVTEETWESEFQQRPYEAKGRLFPKEKLNRFKNLPVDVEPDTIIAACDSADKGSDSCSMPVGYVYGKEVYIVDVVFDNSGAEHTKPECANMLLKHNVKSVTFESNSAGGYFGRDVMELLDKIGGRCSARYKYNTTNKITRMENAADNIIKYYYFLDEDCYELNSQYDKFMKEFVAMTRSGKVSHDDAPDSVALMENEMRNTPASIDATVNPFRNYGY